MEKTERVRIQGLPKFMRCSQLSQERLKLYNELQIWPEHSQAHSEQKAVKILETKGRGRIQRLPNILRTPCYRRNV